MKLRIAALAAASLLTLSSAAVAQDPLKIGFLTTLSGPVGALGQDQLDAFNLALAERNGKLGNVPVEVIVEDDQFRPEIATQAVQKLIEREQVPIIAGVIGSNVLMAINKPIADKGIFMISTNAGPSTLAGAGCTPNLFVLSWQADNFSEAMGKYASDQNYKKVVLLGPNYQAGKDVLGGFKRYFKGEVLDEIYTPLNQPDFSAELSRLAAEKPDAVFAFYPGGLGINFVRQYQQMGLMETTPLLSAGMIDGITLPALKDAALGSYSGSFWGPDSKNPVSQHFVKAFEEKYDRIPSNYAAQAYDAALLLDHAIAEVKGNVHDKAAFGAALKAADFDSLRGNLKFNNNNFPIHDLHVFKVAKDSAGRVNLEHVATPLKGHQDAYHTQCAMK